MKDIVKYAGIVFIAYLIFNAGKASGMFGMQRSRWQPLYDENGKTIFTNAQGRPGVYLIRVNGEIKYIGHSQSNVYKTMYRHFQSWNDKSQVRITYGKNQAEARIIYTTAAQAPRLETYLIKKYRPVDNTIKYDNITAREEEKQADAYQEYTEAETVETDPF